MLSVPAVRRWACLLSEALAKRCSMERSRCRRRPMHGVVLAVQNKICPAVAFYAESYLVTTDTQSTLEIAARLSLFLTVVAEKIIRIGECLI